MAQHHRMRRGGLGLLAGWVMVAACRLGSGPQETARDLFSRMQRGDCDKAVDLLAASRRERARAEMTRRAVTACQTGELSGLQGVRLKHHALRRQDPREATVVVTLELAGEEQAYRVEMVNEAGRWKVDHWARD